MHVKLKHIIYNINNATAIVGININEIFLVVDT